MLKVLGALLHERAGALAGLQLMGRKGLRYARGPFFLCCLASVIPLPKAPSVCFLLGHCSHALLLLSHCGHALLQLNQPEKHLRGEYRPIHKRVGEEQKKRSVKLAQLRVLEVRTHPWEFLTQVSKCFGLASAMAGWQEGHWGEGQTCNQHVWTWCLDFQ